MKERKREREGERERERERERGRERGRKGERERERERARERVCRHDVANPHGTMGLPTHGSTALALRINPFWLSSRLLFLISAEERKERSRKKKK